MYRQLCDDEIWFVQDMIFILVTENLRQKFDVMNNNSDVTVWRDNFYLVTVFADSSFCRKYISLSSLMIPNGAMAKRLDVASSYSA